MTSCENHGVINCKACRGRSRMWENWIIDLTVWEPDQGDLFCFCPIENHGLPNQKVVIGMALYTSLETFDKGKVVGIFHMDGQKVVDSWVKEHPDIVEELERRATV